MGVLSTGARWDRRRFSHLLATGPFCDLSKGRLPPLRNSDFGFKFPEEAGYTARATVACVLEGLLGVWRLA